MDESEQNNLPIPLVLPPPTPLSSPSSHLSCSCLCLSRLMKSILLLLLLFIPISSLLFGYGYFIQLPACELNIPTTLIPLNMATSGVASTATSYFSDLLLRSTTTGASNFNAEDIGLSAWKRIEKTIASFEVGIWLLDDYVDCVKHILLLHSDKSVRIRRAARAVRVLSLSPDVEPFIHEIPLQLRKWSSRKVSFFFFVLFI